MYQIPIIQTIDSEPAMFYVSLTVEGVRRLQQMLQDPMCVSGSQRQQAKFTELQVKSLEQAFIHTQRPTSEQVRDLSHLNGLSEYQVKTWFQNHRSRARLQSSILPQTECSFDSESSQSLVDALAQLIGEKWVVFIYVTISIQHFTIELLYYKIFYNFVNFFISFNK